MNAGYVLELYEKLPAESRVGRPSHAQRFRVAGRRRPMPSGAAPAAGSGVRAFTRHRRRRQPGRVDPALRASGRAHRPARIDATGRPVALAARARHQRRRPEAAAGVARRRPRRGISNNAYDAIEKLRRVYCSTTGFDYAHVFVPEEREWLRHAAESGRFLPPMDRGAPRRSSIGSRRSRSSSASCIARSRARRGSRSKGSTCSCRSSTRLSAEPRIAARGTRIIGMAHRGRLNVLAHILQKPYAQILAEFKDPVALRLQARSWMDGRREVSRRRPHVRAARADARRRCRRTRAISKP